MTPPHGLSWPQYLHDESEIAAYIAEHAVEDVCEEMIEEQYFDSHATLQLVSISEIICGPDDNNIPCKHRQSQYAKLPSETRPPILINTNGTIADGHHRYRDALAKGEELMLAYVAQEGRLAPAPKTALPAMRM